MERDAELDSQVKSPFNYVALTLPRRQRQGSNTDTCSFSQ